MSFTCQSGNEPGESRTVAEKKFESKSKILESKIKRTDWNAELAEELRRQLILISNVESLIVIWCFCFENAKCEKRNTYNMRRFQCWRASKLNLNI